MLGLPPPLEPLQQVRRGHQVEQGHHHAHDQHLSKPLGPQHDTTIFAACRGQAALGACKLEPPDRGLRLTPPGWTREPMSGGVAGGAELDRAVGAEDDVACW